MNSQELQPVGDRELHVVSGEAFSIPIFCDPYSTSGGPITHYVIRPAIELLMAPHLALTQILVQYDLAQEKRFWVIEAASLPIIATKAPGITPSAYYRWEGEHDVKDPQLLGVELDAPKLEGEDFLKFVATRSGMDIKLLRVFWSEWQKAAVEWFINKQQPLKLTFATLRPIPYRINWKEMLLIKHPRCASFFLSWTQERRDIALTETGFIDDLGSAEMAAVDKKRFFYWTLELTANDYWMEAVREAELTRLGTRGPRTYAKYYEARLKKHLPDILEAFTGWLRQMAISVGTVGEGTFSGGAVLLPERKNGVVLPRAGRPDGLHFMVSDGEISLKQGKRPALEKKTQKLLSLPRVQQQVQDVREPSDAGFLGSSRDGGDTDGRVSLHHDGEGENNGQ